MYFEYEQRLYQNDVWVSHFDYKGYSCAYDTES